MGQQPLETSNMKIKFFLKLVLGLLLGTIGHEIYHLIAGNGRLVFTSYGVGVVSESGSSELVAYLITFFVFILFLTKARYDWSREN